MRIYLIIIVLLLIPIGLAEDAEDIAKKDLRSLYKEQGIYAGENQFSDYWARDAFFASFGSNAIGDFNISKSQLQLFIDNQKENGQIPMRIGDYDITLKLLGIDFEQEQRARYSEDKFYRTPVDQNCLFVIAVDDYITKSGDIEFAEQNFDKFERSVIWLAARDQDKNLLVEQGYYTDWMDSVKKRGEVTFTNVCYYKSLVSLSNIAKQTNQTTKYQTYAILSDLVRSEINHKLWLEDGYYSDWLYKDKKYTTFDTPANVLAILWGVTNQTQTDAIIDNIKEKQITDGFGVKTVTPKYERSRVSIINKIAGISDYHHMRWLWVSCLTAKVLDENNESELAAEEIVEIRNKIEEYETVYEVYEEDGEPVDRWFYKSEKPFAWSSGICTYVFENLENV